MGGAGAWRMSELGFTSATPRWQQLGFACTLFPAAHTVGYVLAWGHVRYTPLATAWLHVYAYPRYAYREVCVRLVSRTSHPAGSNLVSRVRYSPLLIP